MPMPPVFVPYDEVACPQPKDPDTIVHSPSIVIPRLTACAGGGGTLHIREHA